MINVEHIRKDFPQFSGRNRYYLDSASTSLTPKTVLDAEVDYYTHSRANVHRGMFEEAQRATELYEDVRKKVAEWIGAKPNEIIFTAGATDSSNMLVRMLEESLHVTKMRKDIVTTIMEHHAAFLPLQQFAIRRDLTLRTIPLSRLQDVGVELDYEKACEFITENTAIASVVLASNVTGEINDVSRIIRRAKSCGVITIVDATAGVGHIPVDVKSLDCDAMYFSGHKMLAPTGVGVLYVRDELLKKLSPSVFGGHMIARMEGGSPVWEESPTRFEAGTKNISGVIGLGSAIDYIEGIGLENIRSHAEDLVEYATTSLSAVSGVEVVSEHDPKKNVGIVAFRCEFAHPHDVAEILARDGVSVRAGHHCAIPLHGALGVESTVRASFHCYNTKEDIDALIVALHKCRTIFQ